MKKYFKVLFVVMSLVPAVSSAWTSRGNGGNVAVCDDKVSGFYDRVELEIRYSWGVDREGIRLFPAMPQGAYFSQLAAEDFLLRLKPLDVGLYNELSGYLSTFFAQTVFVNGYFPTTIDDSGIVVLPEQKCSLQQLVVQKLVFLPPNTMYTISARYWAELNTIDQAAAILHEIIYRAVLERYPNAFSSEGVRMLNELILSNKIKEVSPANFQEFLKVVLNGEDTPTVAY